MSCCAVSCQTIFSSTIWTFATVFGALACTGNEINHQILGYVSVESRWYPKSGAYSDQSHHANGFVLQPELYFESVKGWSFNLVPFLRYDSADSYRSHADLREAYLLLFGEVGGGEWELRLGVDRVFWGVVESHHLVDVINQTDLIEHPDEKAKLGQLMAHVTWSGEWGAAEFFVLPHHRERIFPGRSGRLRSSIIVDNEHASYESADEEWHMGLAARYSQNFELFDVGVSIFDGTSRKPLLQPQLNEGHDGVLALVPHYEQIRQFGLDVQLTVASWLFKLEAIHHVYAQNLCCREEDYAAFVTGGEYTFYSILDSAVDFSVLGEWSYDERDGNATSAFQNDALLATRIAFNDIQNTEIYASILKDREYSTNVLIVELDRRISDRWAMNLELFSLSNVNKKDTQFHEIRRDDFFEFRLNYHF